MYKRQSLINAITGQNTAVTSDIAGTTTDPVYKAMEIHGIGPCMLIDTAGFDDEGSLGALRVEKTRDALAKTDVAIMLFCDADLTQEQEWIGARRAQKTPVVAVVNKADILPNVPEIAEAVHTAFGLFLSLIHISTWLRVGSMLKTSKLSLILTSHRSSSITSTVSAAPAAPAGQACPTRLYAVRAR